MIYCHVLWTLAILWAAFMVRGLWELAWRRDYTLCVNAALWYAVAWAIWAVIGIGAEHIYGHICVSRCAFGAADSAEPPQNARKPLILKKNMPLRVPQLIRSGGSGTEELLLLRTNIYIALLKQSL